MEWCASISIEVFATRIVMSVTKVATRLLLGDQMNDHYV